MSAIQPQNNPPPCPTCGGLMHWKQNRTSGAWFAGCKQWPTCNGTRTADGTDSRVANHVQTRLYRLLVAAVLASEDDCLTFSSAELEQADNHELHIDEVLTEKAFIITVKRKS